MLLSKVEITYKNMTSKNKDSYQVAPEWIGITMINLLIIALKMTEYYASYYSIRN